MEPLPEPGWRKRRAEACREAGSALSAYERSAQLGSALRRAESLVREGPVTVAAGGVSRTGSPEVVEVDEVLRSTGGALRGDEVVAADEVHRRFAHHGGLAPVPSVLEAHARDRPEHIDAHRRGHLVEVTLGREVPWRRALERGTERFESVEDSFRVRLVQRDEDGEILREPAPV